VSWEDLVDVLALWAIYLDFSYLDFSNHRRRSMDCPGGTSVQTPQGNRVRCDILQRCPLLRVS
jgi:hypothetical protein